MSWPWSWPWARITANFWRRSRWAAEKCLTREGLAFGAFLLSVGAGPVLSGMLFYALRALAGAAQWQAVETLAYGLLLALSLLLWSVHRLLGSRQAIEAEIFKIKLKMTQGDDQAPVP